MQKFLIRYNDFLKYIITALIIFVPLYPKFPAFRISESYVAIRLEDFLILFTLFTIFPILIKYSKELIKNKLIRSILIFLLIGSVSLISGVYLTQTTNLTQGLLHYLRRIEYFSLFFVGFVYIRYLNKDKNFFEYVIKLLLLVNFFIFIYGFGQRYFEFPVIITQNEEYSKGVALRWVPGAHINSTFAGHYDLASYLVLVLPIFVASIFIYKDRLSKIIFIGSTILGLWLLSMAASRISVAALFISVTLVFVFLKRFKELALTIFILFIIFATSPDLQVRYKRLFDVVINKISLVQIAYAQNINNEIVFEDRSSSIRLNVEWPRAIRAFSKNPILGTGYSSIGLATDNDYLRLLGEVGILGFSAFLYVIYNIFKYFTKDSLFKVAIMSSLVGILVIALFIDIFEASKFALMFWLFIGLIVGSKNKNYE